MSRSRGNMKIGTAAMFLPLLPGGGAGTGVGIGLVLASALFSLNAKEYALIINGDQECQHQLNVMHAQSAFFNEGFKSEDVYTLSTNNIVPTSDNVSKALESIARTFSTNDTLMIYTTGHGNVNRFGSANHYGDVYLIMDGNKPLYPAKLFYEVKRKLKHPKVVYFGDQCYSQGFADALRESGLDYAAITDISARNTVMCKPFADGIWNSATNEENRSVKEIFEDAARLNQASGLNDYQHWNFTSSSGMENFSFKKPAAHN